MKNVILLQNKCPICNDPIDPEWAGRNPIIGTTCQNCFKRRDELFGPENVELVVQKKVVFNPLFGTYEYHFGWRGTRVMINGKIGTVLDTCLGSCTVEFPEGDKWGDPISTLDYWRLKDIYEKSGGQVEPPPLGLEEYTPTKAPLLKHPILPVEVRMDEDGDIETIRVGNRSICGGLMGQAPELPILPMLHAFCNLFVRYKFGLAQNLACEGGFHGRDFEVRNAGGFTGGCGLSVSMQREEKLFKYVDNEKDFRAMAILEGMIGMMVNNEEQRPGVITDVGAHVVLSTWVNTMETLLRYDWTNCSFDTVEDTWKNYCTMQDVLSNILTPSDLSTVLDYAKSNTVRHAGSSY